MESVCPPVSSIFGCPPWQIALQVRWHFGYCSYLNQFRHFIAHADAAEKCFCPLFPFVVVSCRWYLNWPSVMPNLIITQSRIQEITQGWISLSEILTYKAIDFSFCPPWRKSMIRFGTYNNCISFSLHMPRGMSDCHKLSEPPANY